MAGHLVAGVDGTGVAVGTVLGGVDALAVAEADFEGIGGASVLVIAIENGGSVDEADGGGGANGNAVLLGLQGEERESIAVLEGGAVDVEVDADDGDVASGEGAEGNADLPVFASERDGGRALTEGPVVTLLAVAVGGLDGEPSAHGKVGSELIAREGGSRLDAHKDRDSLTADEVEAVQGGDTKLVVTKGVSRVGRHHVDIDGSLAGVILVAEDGRLGERHCYQ